CSIGIYQPTTCQGWQAGASSVVRVRPLPGRSAKVGRAAEPAPNCCEETRRPARRLAPSRLGTDPRSGDAARYPGTRSAIMSSLTHAPPPKAVLVGVQLPGITDADQRSSLLELKRLCRTLGFEVVGEVTQKRKSLGAATLVGEGKLVELAAWTGGTGVVPKGPPGKKRATEVDDEEEDVGAPL